MQIIKALNEVEVTSALHPRRRIVVLLREDGNFTYAEQYHSFAEHEGKTLAEGWVTLSSFGIFVSAEAAEDEGQAVTSRRLHQPS